MKIGVPGGLLFPKYEEGIRAFFEELEKMGTLKVCYSEKSGPDILALGLSNCVDEACLPVKLFHGHVAKLQNECDRVVIPRLMKCACGCVICPKFAGLPEMVKSGTGRDMGAFTGPLYLNNPKMLSKVLIEGGKELGIPAKAVKEALKRGREAQQEKEGERLRKSLPSPLNRGLKVAVLGHAYNLADPFLNQNLMVKLKRLDVEPILGNSIYISGSLGDRADVFRANELMKEPYWLSFRENYGAAAVLAGRGTADGVIYLSSFGCGTDSFIIDMVKRRLGNLPFLVLKLDEHTGEAGLLTRLEAFVELLERKARHENHISAFG